MTHSIKRIRTFLTAFEAEQAKNLLGNEGIKAFIEGANAQTALSYIGSAVGGVKLLVPAEDVDRAEQALTRVAPKLGPWLCGHCFSEVDEGFDVCWKCGADRNAAHTVDEAEETDDPETPSAAYPSEFPSDQPSSNNPYQPPHPASLGRIACPENVDRFHIEDAADERVQQALTLAIFGIVILPGITHFCSLWLLFSCWSRFGQLSWRNANRFIVAIVLDVTVIAVLTALLLR